MSVLTTPWFDHPNIGEDYPRPQLKRAMYLSLNGTWNLIIETPSGTRETTIRAPFSPESTLSGVDVEIGIHDRLIYQRDVVLPNDFRQGRLILHFDAVDQEADVFVNRRLAIHHLGGYTPFEVDITAFVEGDVFSLQVFVQDVTDTSDRQTGKQRLRKGGIWYTPQSGIWQTVWLEAVPQAYVERMVLTPRYFDNEIHIELETNVAKSLPIHAEVFFEDRLQGRIDTTALAFDIALNERHLWAPETPSLYTLVLNYGDDRIESYFGMRLFERKADARGVQRFYLNEQPYFLTGVLDQGYYPDGLLTPPSDAAMIHDIEAMKKLGFNLLRKHIKIEPLRWYYHCDRLGMIVWQDMVSGSERKDILVPGVLAILGISQNDRRYRMFGRSSQEGRNQFEVELVEMIHHLRSVVSIAAWVPFNEAWGQFDSLRIETVVRSIDSTRLIDHASGWHDQGGGDFYSRHIYFQKIRFPKKAAKQRILALTEFGGYSIAVDGHRFRPDRVFGYKVFSSNFLWQDAIEMLYLNQVLPQVKKGLAVLVYTQLADVEDEVNGFLTYDRQVMKIAEPRMRRINEALIAASKE